MQGTRPSTWPPKGRRNDETVLGCALAGCFLLLSSGMLTLMGGARGDASDSRGDAGYAEDALRPAPARRAPEASAAESRRIAAPGAGSESNRPSRGASGPARPAGSFDLGVYRGLGAWVDQYDFGAAAPEAIVEGIARRGATTLYLQTGRWNLPEDVAGAAAVGAFLEASHSRGIKVVGWYLPGFGDLDRDLRRSLAVLSYSTPSGHRFDGFAPDIEDAREVGGDFLLFSARIVEYSARLRAAVPPGTALGAIVPDAKNNERAPGRWAGFPWPQLGQTYDVMLPMAYWSVTKRGDCRAQQMDAGAYMREVTARMRALLGKAVPIHPIGGIADCTTPEEVAAYVDVALQDGWMGLSLYDFRTTESHPQRDALWGELHRIAPGGADRPGGRARR